MRSENRADRESAWCIHEVLVEQFIKSFKRRPKKLILDFDATDDAVHGRQEGRFFMVITTTIVFYPYTCSVQINC